MRAIAICLFFVIAIPVAAQQKQGTAEVEPRKMLHNFLLAEAQKHFDARKKVVAALKTPEEIARRQAELKAK